MDLVTVTKKCFKFWLKEDLFSGVSVVAAGPAIPLECCFLRLLLNGLLEFSTTLVPEKMREGEKEAIIFDTDD